MPLPQYGLDLASAAQFTWSCHCSCIVKTAAQMGSCENHYGWCLPRFIEYVKLRKVVNLEASASLHFTALLQKSQCETPSEQFLGSSFGILGFGTVSSRTWLPNSA